VLPCNPNPIAVTPDVTPRGTVASYAHFITLTCTFVTHSYPFIVACSCNVCRPREILNPVQNTCVYRIVLTKAQPCTHSAATPGTLLLDAAAAGDPLALLAAFAFGASPQVCTMCCIAVLSGAPVPYTTLCTVRYATLDYCHDTTRYCPYTTLHIVL
jgi:hypothetical protein